MRLPLLIVPALLVSAPAASERPVTPAAAPSVADRNSPGKETCRSARPQYAGSGSVWSGEPLRPKKLDELPPATAYMAVVRTVDGCEVPLTVVEYRNSVRR